MLTLPGYISIRIFQYKYFVLCSFVLYSIVFCKQTCFWMFCSKHLITFENNYLLSWWFHRVDLFYIRFRFFETFTVINSVTRTLLIQTLYKFRTINCLFTLYPHMYVLGLHKFKCFVYPTSLSCVSNSIDVFSVAIKNIRNRHLVLTNQIADISCILTIKS